MMEDRTSSTAAVSTGNPNVLLDEKVIKMRFREYMESESKALGKLTQSASLSDIACKISAIKEADRKRKAAAKPYKYVPPGGWKEPDAALLASLPPGKPNPIETARKMVHISKYRELQKCVIWDSSVYPSKQLEKVLWRKQESDGSGKRIFSLSREAYPKDIPAQWKPGTFDQDLPPAGLDLTTDSFRSMLLRHVEGAPLKVSRELSALPARSTRERNIKGRVAGDLAALESCRDKVKQELARIEEMSIQSQNTKGRTK